MAIASRTITIIILLMLALAGCTSGLWNRSPPPPQQYIGAGIGAVGGAAVGSAMAGAVIPIGIGVGGIIGAAVGDVIYQHQTLVQKLLYNGVQVIRVGDEIRLILPSDRFFYRDSENLNPHYYPILNMIADFLRCIKKVDVKVAAYTDDCGSWRRNLSLSRDQAYAIKRYLVASNIDVRLIYAVGYGGSRPIATNETALGRIMNRRVEITLNKIVPKILV